MLRRLINFRLVVFLLLLLFVFIGIFFAWKYYHTSQLFTVSYSNSHDVVVYDSSTSKAIDIKSSGQVVRLKKANDYQATYKGSAGYADGTVSFQPSSTDASLRINPYYSSSKLESLLKDQLPTINQALVTRYPQIGLYTIQPGKLYHWGDWYGTVLAYNGSYNANSDPLRVVLAKKNNQWVVKTDPPSITLSKEVFSEVPADILNNVNNGSEFQVQVVPPPAGGAHLRQ